VNTRRLYRCRSDRKIAGVAAGMAEYLEVDPTVIRIAWILSAFIGGFTIVLYIILAFVIPLEPVEMPAPGSVAGSGVGADGAAQEPSAGTPTSGEAGALAPNPPWAAGAASPAHAHDRRPADGRPGRASLVIGVLLVVFGAIALVGPFFPGWAASGALGPAFVLALGIALLAGAARRPASER
jgi:phage shock protein C